MAGSNNERRFPSKNYNRGKDGKEKKRGRPRMMLLDWMVKRITAG